MKNNNWEQLVPPTKVEAVEMALRQTFGTANVEAIEVLAGGLSTALNYKIVVKGQAYVMRLVMRIDELSDPVRQFICLNAAAEAGIAPTVHYSNAEHALSIIDFIEHTPLSTWFTTDADKFGELAKTIKAIHALPVFPPLVGFLDGVDSFIERYKSFGILPLTSTEEHFAYYAEIQRVYPRQDTDLVASHNDLNPRNILHQAGRIWVIDWEAAFANDRYVDLAVADIFFGARERGEEILLRTYFGASLNETHRARFFLMRQVCFMYYAMIFMSLVAGAAESGSKFSPDMETVRLEAFNEQLRTGEISLSSPHEHLYYAKVLLNESLGQMKSARFKSSLQILDSQN